MELLLFKKGFNYAQDGRGNRLVYHLQGCNLHCPWCCNPESMPSALAESGFTASVDSILREAMAARPLFYDGGGVTLTGGEPTLQFAAVKQLLGGLKAAGISTAMENNATHPRLRELFPLVDELILDFKHYDEAKFNAATGGSLSAVKQNIAAALHGHGDVLIRSVLINGYNADPEDAQGFCDFYCGLPTRNARFELLPYHDYGKIKWQRLGLCYRMDESAFVDGQTRLNYEKVYRDNGLCVVRT